jgi:hypothetical protein
MTLGAGELLRSLVEFVCMSATFPVRKDGASVARDEAVRGDCRAAGGRAGLYAKWLAGALKMPWNTPL